MPHNTNTDSLKARTTQGVLWRSIEQFGNSGLQFVVAIIIARALSPEDYGIVGMMMVVIALSRVFVESGFGSALIQKEFPTKDDYSSVFYFNLFMSAGLYVLLFLCSPLVAKFFNQPMLLTTLRVMSIILVVDALSIAHNTSLVKNLQFKRTAIISTCSAMLAGFIGIAMAYSGHGVWSLVAKTLAYGAFRTLGLWIMSEWRPYVRINLKPIKAFYSYSSKLLASALIHTLFQNLLTLVIGKFYTAADLGNYSKANQLHQVPAVTTTHVVGSVTFPVLASIQSDDTRLKHAYKRILKTLVFVVFPMMILLAATAKNLILFLLTDKWSGVILLLQILSLGGMLYPLHAVTLNISKVKGRSDVFLNLEIVKNTIVLVAVMLAIPLGVTGMVAATTVCSYILYFLNGHYNGRLIRYSVGEQIRDVAPVFCVAILAGAASFFTGFMGGPTGLMLALQLFVGGTLYFALAWIFCREQIMEVRGMIGDIIGK